MKRWPPVASGNIKTPCLFNNGSHRSALQRGSFPSVFSSRGSRLSGAIRRYARREKNYREVRLRRGLVAARANFAEYPRRVNILSNLPINRRLSRVRRPLSRAGDKINEEIKQARGSRGKIRRYAPVYKLQRGRGRKFERVFRGKFVTERHDNRVIRTPAGVRSANFPYSYLYAALVAPSTTLTVFINLPN